MGVLVWTGGEPFPEPVPGPAVHDLMNPPYHAPKVRASDHMAPAEGNGRTLFVLAFRDTGDEKREQHSWPPDSIQHRDWRNLQFFAQHVIGGKRALDMDFILVDTTSSGPAMDLNDLPKRVRYVHRENVGFDMCSYKILLALVHPGEYKYIVLMNGGLRGPFARSTLDFLAPFKSLLAPDVPVVGTTAACCDHPHIQSMFYMVNSIGAELLNASLSCAVANKHEATWGPHGEINISRNVLAAGFNFAVLQGFWRGHDFRDDSLTTDLCHVGGRNDSCDSYFPMGDRDRETLEEKDVDPEEVIFFKTNRAVNDGRLQWLTKVYDASCRSGGKFNLTDLCSTWAVRRSSNGGLFMMWLVFLASLVILGYLFRKTAVFKNISKKGCLNTRLTRPHTSEL